MVRMKRVRELVVLVFVIIALIGNASIVMADVQDSSDERVYEFAGYSYNPRWSERISFNDSSLVKVKYENRDESLLGKLEVEYKNDMVKIPFTLKYDVENDLFYGYSEFEYENDLKNVNLVFMMIDGLIGRIDLIVDSDIAYTFGNEVSFEKMSFDVSTIKATELKESGLEPKIVPVGRSSDSSIIGSDTLDGLYVHTTLEDLALNEENWMGTRVFTTSSHALSHITYVEISGSKTGTEFGIQGVLPVGTYSKSVELEEFIFYFGLGYYLGVDVPVEGYSGAGSSSQWEHTYNMWDSWNDHIYNSISTNNGVVSDVKMKRINSSGGLSGVVSVDVTEYITATGYFYHDLSYSYSK